MHDSSTIQVHEWRKIPFLDGYFIRSDGAVESRVRSRRPRRLKPWLTRDGYRQYLLNGRKYYAHRLVLAVFIGPPPSPDMVADHRNFCRTDNRVANLRWLSRGDNARRKSQTAHLFD